MRCLALLPQDCESDADPEYGFCMPHLIAMRKENRRNGHPHPFLYGLSEPKTLHSGEFSSWFVDGLSLFVSKQIRQQVLCSWERAINGLPHSFILKPWYFVPVPRGGIPWALAAAKYLEGLFVPKRPPDADGTFFIVDDIMTTGKSILGTGKSYDNRLCVVKRSVTTMPKVISWMTVDLEE